MFCPKCGNELKEQDKFCPKCGEPNAGYRKQPQPAAPKTEETFFFAPAESAAPLQNEYRPSSGFDFSPNTASGEFSAYQPQQAPVEENKPENPIFGTLGMIFGILGMWPGLILAIIGLAQYKDPKNRKKCKIGIGFVIGWFAFSFVLGIVLGLLGIDVTDFFPLAILSGLFR